MSSEVKDFMNENFEVDFFNPNTFHNSILDVNGKLFYVNSGILSVWSKYFDNWYKTLEEQLGRCDRFPVIRLGTIHADVMEMFLRLIYPGVPNINESQLPILVNFSFMFESPGVLEICKNFIYNNFETLDKIQLLDLACYFPMDDIKDHTMAHINRVLPSINLIELTKIAFEHELEDLKRNIRTVIFANVAKPAPRAVIVACSQCLNGLKVPECVHEEKEELLFNPFIYENMEKILKLSEPIKDFIFRSTVRYQ